MRTIYILVVSYNDPITTALKLLGEILSLREENHYHLVVCGGTALRAANVTSRVTRDVDLLATRGVVDGEITSAWPLPVSLREAVEDVATELDLPANWLNASAALLIGDLAELPADIWKFLDERQFGNHLRISFVGRAGMIPLKFQAALERHENRDLEDLKSLSPTTNEIKTALKWLRRKELDDTAKKRLEEILTLLGYESN